MIIYIHTMYFDIVYQAVYITGHCVVHVLRYQACYEYQINSGECSLILNSLDVSAPQTFDIDNSTLILLRTPETADRVYPSDTICFFVIGNK